MPPQSHPPILIVQDSKGSPLVPSQLRDIVIFQQLPLVLPVSKRTELFYECKDAETRTE
jgi:hypothetical protein